MESILLLIVITYSVSLSFGFLLQKYLRIPWMFAALFFGVILAEISFFTPSIQSETFQSLATLGMLIFLFMIGFNLDLKEMKALGKYIFLGTIFIISLEGFCGSLLLYFGFPSEVSNSFLIALITAMSFATVGEAVLLPILAEFKVVNTTFGQLTLGIGTFDDVIEVLMLAILATLPAFLPKAQIQSLPNPSLTIISLISLLFLTLALTRPGNKLKNILRRTQIRLTYIPS